jgi:hypothetical protein
VIAVEPSIVFADPLIDIPFFYSNGSNCLSIVKPLALQPPPPVALPPPLLVVAFPPLLVVVAFPPLLVVAFPPLLVVASQPPPLLVVAFPHTLVVAMLLVIPRLTMQMDLLQEEFEELC